MLDLRRYSKLSKTSVAAFIMVIVILLIIPYITMGQEGSAGVGVLNVPPEYSETRIVTEDGIMKIYLTISDYNSWSDIYNVTVTIENDNTINALFLFRHYESKTSIFPLAEFEEKIGKNYLIESKCKYQHSDKTDTVSDRCLLHLVFAFYPVPGNKLTILTYDKGGLSAKTYIEYNVEGVPRSTSLIMVPWMTTPVEFPVDTLDALAVAFATTATCVIIIRRLKPRGQKST
ncbi:MAG TPA: hypothetical protein ENG24_00860 [Thermoplasmatales archaeon]|nr:hypothetical protein [Thermoplasmatales archaeon]